MSDDYHSGLTRDLAPFGLRIPVELKKRIKHASVDNNRSMSAEIIHALEQAYPAPSSVSEVQKKLDRVMARWDAASTDDERRDLLDHLTQIRGELSAVVDREAESRAEERLEREREAARPVKDRDIPS